MMISTMLVVVAVVSQSQLYTFGGFGVDEFVGDPRNTPGVPSRLQPPTVSISTPFHCKAEVYIPEFP